jgi:hypothetical protein
VMVESDAPVGSKPVNVAPLIIALWPRMKSSAVSVSSSPALTGLDKVAILPSGLPVLNNSVDAPDGSSKATRSTIA